MNIVKKRRNLFVGLFGLSLAMLLISVLYLDEQKKQVKTELVFQEKEVLQLPVIEKSEELIEVPMKVNAEKVISFYESGKDENELMQAVSEYQGIWRPSQSVCYSFSNKVFEITAMVSGTVSEIYQDELMGKCVEVDCGNGLVITYQSLSNVNVLVNQAVRQFEVIGLAGENSYHAALGVHAQITAHLNGELIDPEQLIHNKVSELN